jgi:hypothetical protein
MSPTQVLNISILAPLGNVAGVIITGGTDVLFRVNTPPPLLPGKTRVGSFFNGGGTAFGMTTACPGGGSAKSQGRGTNAAGHTQVAAQTTPLPLF